MPTEECCTVRRSSYDNIAYAEKPEPSTEPYLRFETTVGTTMLEREMKPTTTDDWRAVIQVGAVSQVRFTDDTANYLGADPYSCEKITGHRTEVTYPEDVELLFVRDPSYIGQYAESASDEAKSTVSFKELLYEYGTYFADETLGKVLDPLELAAKTVFMYKEVVDDVNTKTWNWDDPNSSTDAVVVRFEFNLDPGQKAELSFKDVCEVAGGISGKSGVSNEWSYTIQAPDDASPAP